MTLLFDVQNGYGRQEHVQETAQTSQHIEEATSSIYFRICNGEAFRNIRTGSNVIQ